MSRKLLKFLIAVIISYAILIGLMYGMQRTLMYVPDRANPMPSDTSVPMMQEVMIRTSDGLLNESWLHLPDDPKAPFIVMFHGNALNIGARDFKAKTWIDAGFGVMLVGYRGYGGNPGSPSEEGLLKDAGAALEYLIKQRQIPTSQLVLYGESLGSGLAVPMAAKFPDIRGLILEVPFDSALGVAQARYPFIIGLSGLMKDQYRSDDVIATIKMPKLFLLADNDWIVPKRHGQKLFDLAAEPKTLKTYAGSGHNQLYDHGAGVDVVNFVKNLPVPAAPLSSGVTAKPLGAASALAIKNDLPPHPISGLKQEYIILQSVGREMGRVQVELAIEPPELERGLMGRTELPPGTGMLFILPENMIASFWMRDTLIPLDLVFIDQGGRIANIYKGAEPLNISTISSQFPVRAVLEIAAGQVDAYGLQLGDLVMSPTLDRMVAEGSGSDVAPDQELQ